MGKIIKKEFLYVYSLYKYKVEHIKSSKMKRCYYEILDLQKKATTS